MNGTSIEGVHCRNLRLRALFFFRLKGDPSFGHPLGPTGRAAYLDEEKAKNSYQIRA